MAIRVLPAPATPETKVRGFSNRDSRTSYCSAVSAHNSFTVRSTVSFMDGTNRKSPRRRFAIFSTSSSVNRPPSNPCFSLQVLLQYSKACLTKLSRSHGCFASTKISGITSIPRPVDLNLQSGIATAQAYWQRANGS